eukprot:GHVO01054154.1.p1 GENE.GHVO01054154.1~~GHVO01054154.1.p1  ORF type:complete len:655 (+),score=40.51 GHVO01054154.1:25-1989(+)
MPRRLKLRPPDIRISDAPIRKAFAPSSNVDFDRINRKKIKQSKPAMSFIPLRKQRPQPGETSESEAQVEDCSADRVIIPQFPPLFRSTPVQRSNEATVFERTETPPRIPLSPAQAQFDDLSEPSTPTTPVSRPKERSSTPTTPVRWTSSRPRVMSPSFPIVGTPPIHDMPLPLHNDDFLDLPTPPAPRRRRRHGLASAIVSHDREGVRRCMSEFDEDPNEPLRATVNVFCHLGHDRSYEDSSDEVITAMCVQREPTLPLLIAAAHSTPGVVQELLSAGAEVNGVNERNQNALHFLCLQPGPDYRKDAPDTVQDSVTSNPDVKAFAGLRKFFGESPQSDSTTDDMPLPTTPVRNNESPCTLDDELSLREDELSLTTEMLIVNGCCTNLVDVVGKTPHDYASLFGHAKVREALRRAEDRERRQAFDTFLSTPLSGRAVRATPNTRAEAMEESTNNIGDEFECSAQIRAKIHTPRRQRSRRRIRSDNNLSPLVDESENLRIEIDTRKVMEPIEDIAGTPAPVGSRPAPSDVMFSPAPLRNAKAKRREVEEADCEKSPSITSTFVGDDRTGTKGKKRRRRRLVSSLSRTSVSPAAKKARPKSSHQSSLAQDFLNKWIMPMRQKLSNSFGDSPGGDEVLESTTHCLAAAMIGAPDIRSA